MRGGKRPGAGKPKGSKDTRSKLKEWAKLSKGDPPHIFLAKIAAGETFEAIVQKDGEPAKSVTVTPTLKTRIQAAIAAAPYFAPKLAQIEQKIETETVGIMRSEPMTVEEWAKEFGIQDSMGTTTRTTTDTHLLPVK
jgi:hypothetical protein